MHDGIDEFLCFKLDGCQREPEENRVTSFMDACGRQCTLLVPQDTIETAMTAHRAKDFTGSGKELNICVASGEVFRRIFYNSMIDAVKRLVADAFRQGVRIILDREKTITQE